MPLLSPFLTYFSPTYIPPPKRDFDSGNFVNTSREKNKNGRTDVQMYHVMGKTFFKAKKPYNLYLCFCDE